MKHSYAGLLVEGRARLKAAGIETYSLDALVLLAHASGKKKEWFLAHGEDILPSGHAETFFSYITRRERFEPVQYIVNACEFMGLTFYVDENVLIPRADTEILSERVIEAAKKLESPKVLDLCTGSGCVAVACAYYCVEAAVAATDINAGALTVARRNAGSNGVAGRISFCEGDLFGALESGIIFDVVAANPPYITHDEFETLPEPVKYEPKKALDGGANGLMFYERIAGGALTRLAQGGVLLLEIGCGQAESVCGILNRIGYNNINIYKDLSGRDRVVEGVKI